MVSSGQDFWWRAISRSVDVSGCIFPAVTRHRPNMIKMFQFRHNRKQTKALVFMDFGGLPGKEASGKR
jgi:hypothetical protein